MGGKPLEIWFADEARIGQKNKITRRWAKRGTRPSAPKDQRTASAYTFGAICPAHGKGAGLVLPRCTTTGMSLHLAEISRHVAAGAQAILVLDGAGWHGAAALALPENITLLPLPPYSPELNPVENVWQYLRQNQLSLRVWPDYEAIVETCCRAWNALMAMPDRIASITRREWAAKAVSR